MDLTKPPKDASKKNQSSCELCQRRKVRCDKDNPCSTCRRAGVKCEVSSRQRLPRGRNGGRRKGDLDLKARIAKLENLVSSLGGNESAKNAIPPRDQGQANIEAAPKPPSDMSRYLGSSFWSTLSTEVNGLREVLDADTSDSESETLEQSESADTPPNMASRGFNFVLCGPDSFMMAPNALEHPPRSMVELLYSLYFSNVDPLFKVLHKPSIADLMLKGRSYLGRKPSEPSVEALSFAIYYSAINTQDDRSCRQKFGDEKIELLNRYRFALEVCLARADFVNSAEIEVIQAFASVRLNDHSRWSWTLFALLVRMAQALGLNTHNLSSSLTAFQIEMRRRLWHQITILDINAALDRGTEPIISERFSDTRILPSNINDTDIMPTSEGPITSRHEWTDMSFCLMGNVEKSFVRCLVHGPASETALEKLQIKQDWHGRQEIVENYKSEMNEQYLRHCNINIPFQWFAVTVADIMAVSMMLLAIRPMQVDPRIGYPRVDSLRVLQLSIDGMQKHRDIMANPLTEPWRWFVWVQWHALAVALAELCSQTEGPLVERAWKVVDVSYEEYAKTVADTKSGMLWQPVQKLMKKAKQTRRTVQIASLSLGDNGRSAVNVPMHAAFSPELSGVGFTGPGGMIDSGSSANDSSHAFGQTGLWGSEAGLLGPGSIDSHVPAPLLPLIHDSVGGPPPTGDLSSDPFSFDLTDASGTLESGLPSDMAWLNWENFIGDVNVSDFDMPDLTEGLEGGH